MAVEISAGAVVFRKENNQNLFLLLRYPAINHRSGVDYWDYVKGHVEKGEKPLATVAREAEEETGIKDINFIGGFSETMEYFFTYKGEKIFKTVSFYLARTAAKDIILSDEHNDYAWLPYDEAYKALSFDNAKQILKKANEFLKKQESLNRGSVESSN